MLPRCRANAARLLRFRETHDPPPPTPPRHSLREWEEGRTRGTITAQRQFGRAESPKCHIIVQRHRLGLIECAVAEASPMPTGPEHPFSAPYAPPDEAIADKLLAEAARAAAAELRIDARATKLIAGIRAEAGGLGGIEDFLHAYSLS